MVHHVFAEIPLAPVSAGFGTLTLYIAVLAAGDVVRRAGRHGVVGAAVGVVVIVPDGGDRSLMAGEAPGERQGDDGNNEERTEQAHRSLFEMGALFSRKYGICKSGLLRLSQPTETNSCRMRHREEPNATKQSSFRLRLWTTSL